MIVFRVLGFVVDRDILEYIIYDFDDLEMMEMVRSLSCICIKFKFVLCVVNYSFKEVFKSFVISFNIVYCYLRLV